MLAALEGRRICLVVGWLALLLPQGHFAWRSARYSSASNAVNWGGNVKDVQVLMDHSSVTTTERYARYANHQKILALLFWAPRKEKSINHLFLREDRASCKEQSAQEK